MLGISIDPWPSAGAFANSLGLTFPVLSDWPEYQVCNAYGTWWPDRKLSHRVTFVLDKEGIIRGQIANETDMEVHSREALRIVRELAKGR